MKRKIIALSMAAVLIFSLVSCGSNNNTSTDRTTSEDRTETKDILETIEQAQETETTVELVIEETVPQVEETTQQETIEQNVIEQPAPPPVVVEENTTVAQNEQITQPQIYKVQPNAYPNPFSLITSATEYPGGLDEYMKFLRDSGATEVTSTTQAVDLLSSTCTRAVNGLNICFISDDDGKGIVDINKVLSVLPRDTELGKYIDGNIYEYQTRYTSDYFGVRLTWWTTQSEETALDTRVSQAAATFSGTAYDKIKAAHDYVCNATDYCYETYEGRDNNYSAYDALYGGKAVCQGYALAFQKFMDKLKIPCYIAKGVIYTNGTTEPHAWNLVQLDGKWYYVDCTWDGQTSETKYAYFLRGAGYNGYSSWGGVEVSAVDYTK